MLGRGAWEVIATGLGVAPTPRTPLLPLSAILLVAMLASAAVALLPGRSASRLRAIEALRAE